MPFFAEKRKPKINRYKFYSAAYGIVFVVDASDEDRLEECKKILHETEMQPRVAGKPLLM